MICHRKGPIPKLICICIHWCRLTGIKPLYDLLKCVPVVWRRTLHDLLDALQLKLKLSLNLHQLCLVKESKSPRCMICVSPAYTFDSVLFPLDRMEALTFLEIHTNCNFSYISWVVGWRWQWRLRPRQDAWKNPRIANQSKNMVLHRNSFAKFPHQVRYEAR